MPRFLTPEWVDAFNDALSGVALPAEAAEGSLAAASGRFSVTQVVHDVPPDGTSVRTTLAMADGRLELRVDEHADDGVADAERAQVTVSLGYPDAAALSRGELSPAEVLATGRVRVRGDLAVLVASQALMAEAGQALGELRAVTTY